MAKGASKRAADLGGHAQCAASAIGDEDGFDLVTIGKFEEPFLRLVEADGVARNTRALDGVCFSEQRLRVFFDGAHLRKFGRALGVDPLPNLFGTEGLNPQIGDALGELLTREANKRWLGRKLFGAVIRVGCGFFDDAAKFAHSAGFRAPMAQRQGKQRLAAGYIYLAVFPDTTFPRGILPFSAVPEKLCDDAVNVRKVVIRLVAG